MFITWAKIYTLYCQNLDSYWALKGLPNESWSISKMNLHYELCDTYPSILVLPNNMTEDNITQVASFRAKCRLPVSYVHRCLFILTGPGTDPCNSS
ncbi:hypothetical protein GOODEAATRI_005393 [Goodea atripinnis]|uniref:Myotubularin phosphatase domain-containing protein n=1 Tax=Goodea atripinnis TaxID=208336 RepID=A0ABV0PW78_9TELE